MTPFKKLRRVLYCKIKKKTTIMKIGTEVSELNNVFIYDINAF